MADDTTRTATDLYAVAWNHGTPSRRSAPEAPIQVHRHDQRTWILRQSKTLNYEAPFLFLLLGTERALLLDTGAVGDPEAFPLRATVDSLLAEHLAAHPREDYRLVVAHTHPHGDHVAADGQFADRPATVVVGHGVEAVREFFGFTDDTWPTGSVVFDLGGRPLELLPSPGHHEASVTVHDPATGWLLTGDTVLPGRLYISDAAAYLATLDRLVDFAKTHEVSHVLGCHVEMTDRPRRDYPLGAVQQPRERPLPLTAAHLSGIRDAVAALGGKKDTIRAYDDFVVYLEPGHGQAPPPRPRTGPPTGRPLPPTVTPAAQSGRGPARSAGPFRGRRTGDAAVTAAAGGEHRRDTCLETK
ncbi:MBL fold metallo-hydrolase [Streptacidiphilus monticola]|uniref:MBL fold metallo-hydrolase n=1 Tax=Streptacidiphilus monticola TaxID=2161674 RepID=A0ABW1G3K9_9ACTN